MRVASSMLAVISILFFTRGMAHAQTTPQTSTNAQPSTSPQQREDIERQLKELRSMKQDLQKNMQDMQRQMNEFNSRIDALGTQLGVPQPKEEAAPQPNQGTNGIEAKNV